MRAIISGFLVFFSSILFSTPAEMTLNNGLKILVEENHRAPIAVTMLWYHVGAADEPEGLTGLSHLLEHLLFKGTAKNPEGTFQKSIAKTGGDSNAFTHFDYTAYINKTPVSALPTVFALEADRMQHLLFQEDSFQKELNVVQEERRLRVEDRPEALAFEHYLAHAALTTPYHHPIIGSMSDLKQLNLKDAESWYRHFYAPNHATLLVVGDVQKEAVFALAKEHFETLKPTPSFIRKSYQTAPSLGPKSIEVRAKTPLKRLFLGFPAPSFKNNDLKTPATLQLIATILDNGDHARLSKSLIHQKKIALHTDIYYNPFMFYDTQFVLITIPTESQSFEHTKSAVLKELARMRNEPVTDTELLSAKQILVAKHIFSNDAITTQAEDIGLIDTLGLSKDFRNAWVKTLESVTKADLQNIAKNTFNEEALTELRLVPKTSNGIK